MKQQRTSPDTDKGTGAHYRRHRKLRRTFVVPETVKVQAFTTNDLATFLATLNARGRSLTILPLFGTNLLHSSPDVGSDLCHFPADLSVLCTSVEAACTAGAVILVVIAPRETMFGFFDVPRQQYYDFSTFEVRNDDYVEAMRDTSTVLGIAHNYSSELSDGVLNGSRVLVIDPKGWDVSTDYLPKHCIPAFFRRLKREEVDSDGVSRRLHTTVAAEVLLELLYHNSASTWPLFIKYAEAQYPGTVSQALSVVEPRYARALRMQQTKWAAEAEGVVRAVQKLRWALITLVPAAKDKSLAHRRIQRQTTFLVRNTKKK